MTVSLPRRRLLGAVASSASLMVQASPARTATPRFAIGESDFLLDGQPLQIRCGEMHFARVPREYWRHRLQAIKAMGMNAVCAYLFWNYHEWREGQYRWEGQRDAAEFCRQAQAEGLWVILRPGPYACAEWEMGGLPWWLLKQHPGDAFLRSGDAAFVQPVRRWMVEVGRVLAPQQVSQGGPILMVQVENEYGFYGDDKQYMRTMRQAVLDGGFDVPLFQCNPTNAVAKTHIPELLTVANFGSDPERGFQALAQLQKAPLMCGEYYSGWFDTWGTPHRRGDNARAVRDIDTMLKANGSFSLYMAHGGTSFGLWAGCDRPFRPDTSSYDYDAPISEAGWLGQKFQTYRDCLARHLKPGEQLPDPPVPKPVMRIEAFKLEETAAVLENMPLAVAGEVASPLPIEHYDISRGLVAYRSSLPAGPAGRLVAANVRDLAWVFVGGRLVGTMDTRHRRFSVDIPARSADTVVEILLYTIARVNFGVEVHDRKGLQGPVVLHTGATQQAIAGWQIRAIDFDADALLPKLAWRPGTAAGPAFWRGAFETGEVADTFLDMSDWGQGIAWVNGICLGRYWSIGPTQTMYLPGVWLRKGRNEVVVLDLTGPRSNRIQGVTVPVLDQLRPELDLPRPVNTARPRLAGVAAVHAGEFASGGATQEVRFAQAVRGRQVCLEVLDAHDGLPHAAVAELSLLNSQGKALNQSNWTIAYVSSEESRKEDGSALNAINGQASDHWHTAYSSPALPAGPHRLVVDLGASVELFGLRYTPRQGRDGVTGRVRQYRIFVGDRLVQHD